MQHDHASQHHPLQKMTPGQQLLFCKSDGFIHCLVLSYLSIELTDLRMLTWDAESC